MEVVLEETIMRVGIAGAQSVGKTTLLNGLRSEIIFKSYAVCNEVTRKVLSYGLPINESGSSITQKLIMQEHIVNVFMHDKMITDRTALDGLVYTKYLHRKGTVDADTLNYAWNVFHKVWPHYDHVFYIEPEFEIEDDGVRSVDTNFRDAIVELFNQVIEKEGLNVIRLTGSVRNRINMVVNILEGR